MLLKYIAVSIILFSIWANIGMYLFSRARAKLGISNNMLDAGKLKTMIDLLKAMSLGPFSFHYQKHVLADDGGRWEEENLQRWFDMKKDFTTNIKVDDSNSEWYFNKMTIINKNITELLGRLNK